LSTLAIDLSTLSVVTATEVSVDDRFRIQDVLRSYVWANDSGSVEAVVAAFIPDGIVQLATEERTPVRGWTIETFAQPGRRGHQHWCSTLRSRAPERGCGAFLLQGGAGACLYQPGRPPPWAAG
jgi:hypothetical protein